MLKKLVFLSSLVIALLFSTSCTNLLSERNKEGASISITLPYGKSSASRAADQEKEVYNFTVTFKHETLPAVEMTAKSGESLTYNDAPVGKYAITVKGVTESGKKAEGFAEALVEDGKAANVSVILKVVEDGLIEINILSFTDELANMVKYYIKEHPDCGLVINHREVATTQGEYTPYLNKMLDGTSSEFVPDLYTAEAAFVLHYTQGSMGRYALPYKELIPDVDEKIKAAEYAQYVVDVGKNSSGAVVGLAYQSTGGAFIYNRTVAKDVFGTDNPKEIEKEIGAGSGDWTKFWEAAETCKSKNVAIISGDGDLWHPVSYTAEEGWVVNEKLHIDANREAFLDYSKNLTEKGYSNNTQDWTDEWYLDMDEKGPKKVLGFFGPAWLLNYTFAEKSVDTKGDWAVCAPPVGFSWGGSWIEVNKAVENASAEKKEAIAKLIEWLTLDTTEDGLLYNWANGKVTGNTKDTVSSAVVMKKSDGRLDFLGGQDMFECYIPMNEQVNAKNLTEYDDEIDRIWREQVRLYADERITRKQALSNFIYFVKARLGIDCDSDIEVNNYYESEHIKAEPDPNGKGIKITLTCKEGEKWESGASFIWEQDDHFGIRIEEVPTFGKPVVCYYPLTEDNKGYRFNAELAVDSGVKIYEQFYVIANGGNEFFELEGENYDIAVSGTKMKLPENFTYTINKSKNVKEYLTFNVFTTNEKNEGERWDVAWKEWLNSGRLSFDKIDLLKTEGFSILNLDVDTYRKLQKEPYYCVNLTVEFTIEGIPNSFRTWISAYSDVITADLDTLYTNETDHIKAEPDSDGKGIRFTISAKTGEKWKKEWYRINDVNSGLYMEVRDRIPEPGKPIVCYWPFTTDGEVYAFECEVKLEGNNDIIHENVRSKAKGSYANLNINYEAVSDLRITVNSDTATVNLSKDISNAITCSENVTATCDFGSFTRPESEEQNSEWINSIFPSVFDSNLYGSGKGVALFENNLDTIKKLKRDKYYDVEMTLNFEIEGLSEVNEGQPERYRYSNGYKSSTYDSTSYLSKADFSTNNHISVTACEQGIKVTLRKLETDNDWVAGNTLICLASDYQDGVNLSLAVKEEFENNVIPETKRDNRCPTQDEPEVTYIYPFTENGKVYEFLLAGPLDKEGTWQSEYVSCKAGGGVGELINYDIWNNDVKVEAIDYQNYTFKITGDVASIIDNTGDIFEYAELWPDVRPGVDGKENVDHRSKTFGYASRRLVIVGQPDEWQRSLDDLKNPLVVENDPEYENGTMNEDNYNYEDVFEVLREWNNQFFVVMSIQEIRLKDYPNMTYHLHWK